VNTMVWLANNNYESGRIPSNEIQKISNNSWLKLKESF
jgi:hypothetical protein